MFDDLCEIVTLFLDHVFLACFGCSWRSKSAPHIDKSALSLIKLPKLPQLREMFGRSDRGFGCIPEVSQKTCMKHGIGAKNLFLWAESNLSQFQSSTK